MELFLDSVSTARTYTPFQTSYSFGAGTRAPHDESRPIVRAPFTHAELMHAIGSKEGFDPMPPTQHTWFLDVGESMTSRAIAWLWSKTIRPGRGHRRSPFARDERGRLTLKHAAADLGWTLSNASAVFKKLEEQGRLRRDENGHIWLCGAVPSPRRTNDETFQSEELPEDPENELETAAENEDQVICTYNLPPSLLLYFEQHPKKESRQWARDYFRLQKYRQKIESDALAAARTKGEELENNFYTAIGFEPPQERRGRRRVERQETVQLSLLSLPKFSVHISPDPPPGNSVQNSNGHSVQKKNNSVHKTSSLLSSELSELSELASSDPPENELEEVVVEVIARSHLEELGGKSVDLFTVRNLRSHLERLPSHQVKAVLDVLEEKCRHLARHPNEARQKTWGWIVGIVKGEVSRLATTATTAIPKAPEEPDPLPTAEELRKQAIEIAMAKKMR